MIITAPSRQKTVFLAGSCGQTENWQEIIGQKLSLAGWTVFNPRRKDWNSSWVESISDTQFKYQVEWELEHMLKSDYVFFYFAPDSLAVVSMLEFGLCLGKDKNMVVVCPEGFYKKGNIDVTDKFIENMNCIVYDNLESGVKHLLNLST